MEQNNFIYNDAYLQTINPNMQNKLDQLRKKYAHKVLTKGEIAQLLTIALIDEFLAEYNYYASYNLSKTDGKVDFDPEFQQHQSEQRSHRYDLTNRLRQMDVPVPSIPLQNYFTENSDGQNWKQELENNSNKILLNRMIEQEKAIKFYSFILFCLKMDKTQGFDSTTFTLIKKIKADEQQHLKDLRDLAKQRALIK